MVLSAIWDRSLATTSTTSTTTTPTFEPDNPDVKLRPLRSETPEGKDNAIATPLVSEDFTADLFTTEEDDPFLLKTPFKGNDIVLCPFVYAVNDCCYTAVSPNRIKRGDLYQSSDGHALADVVGRLQTEHDG